MNLKIIFTWWNRQTFGTFLKTLFFGKLVGKDEFGNKYYRNKLDERWVVYSNNIEATKITSDWFLWMHYTVDKVPEINEKKHLWQKNHSENKTYLTQEMLKEKILATNLVYVNIFHNKNNLKKYTKVLSKVFSNISRGNIKRLLNSKICFKPINRIN